MFVTASAIIGLVIVEPGLRAQSTSPGGVTGSSLWVKADQGLQANASNQVSQWLDQSGSGNITTQLQASIDDTTKPITPTNDILRVPVAINFNPAVGFDGATDRSLKGAAATSFGGGSISIYAASIVEGVPNGNLAAVFDSLNDWNAGLAVGVGLGIASTTYALDGSGCMTASTTSATNVPRVARGVYVTTTNGNGGSTWLDGVREATGGNCGATPGPLFEVGGRTGGPQSLDNRIFKGKIAEVIVYKSVLTAADATKVESYLALKYGITLRQTPSAQSYTDSTGAAFWDSTLNATHKNNIAGIGRDDGSALVQRQSQSVNTASSGNLITMGLGTIATDNVSNGNSFAADRNFLVWGDDGASASFATPITTPISVPTTGPAVRMTRTWRVQETGTVPSVGVGVPTATAPGALVYLVVSNDTTFDSTDQWIPMSSFSAGTTTYMAANVDFATGQYFTFASVPLTDLVMTKTDNQTIYVPGKPISYSLVVTNGGASNATGVSVTDTVPATITGVTAICTSAGTAACGTNASSGNNVSFTGASIAAGAGNQLTITVNGTVSASATGSLVNAATVAPGAGQNDPNTANNTATDTDTPAQADVSITKGGPASATPGTPVVYAITVTNNGPNLAAAVSVSDPTPPGLTFVSNSGACTTPFPCALGDLTLGATRTITTTYQLPSTYTTPDPITNTATATTVTADPSLTNNTSTVTTPVSAQSDVQIVKNVSSAPVLPGQNYTYTLQVTNNGPSIATGVVATDTLPSQVAFVSSAAGCTAVGQAVMCPTIPTLAVGATQGFDIVVQLSPTYSGNGSDILNSATVASTSTDPALQNNTTPAGAPPVGPPGADVTIVKSVNSTPVAPGETFTYSLLVSNQGPSIATDVVATDNLPTPLTFVSSPDGCTAAGQMVTCPTIATLNPGGFVTFNLVVQLDPAYAGNGSDLGNTATVQSATTDPVPSNNTTGPVPPNLGPPSADLSITKAAVEPSVMPGRNFTYHLTVTNAGPSVAQSISVTDALPTPLHFISSPQGCTAAGQVVTCTQAMLAAGAPATFDVIVQLDAAYIGNGSDLGNIASTTSTTSDPNTANSTTATAPPPTIVLGSADLTIDKTGPAGRGAGAGRQHDHLHADGDESGPEPRIQRRRAGSDAFQPDLHQHQRRLHDAVPVRARRHPAGALEDDQRDVLGGRRRDGAQQHSDGVLPGAGSQYGEQQFDGADTLAGEELLLQRRLDGRVLRLRPADCQSECE